MRTLKELKWDNLLTSLLYIIIGIVLLIFPETTARTLGYLVGGVAILAGAVSIICYLLRDAHQNYFRNDFVYGLAGIALGCFIFYKVDLIISLIPFILGLLVVISGCSKLQDVIDMKRMGYGNWVFMLILAVINVIFGIVLMCNPFDTAVVLFRLIGAGLVFSGVSDGIVTLFFAGKVKRYMKDQEASVADFKEIDE